MFQLSELFFVIFCYIVLIGILLWTSFSNYSTYVKAPFYTISFLLIIYVTYVAATFWSETDSQTDKQLFEIFQRSSIIYGEYILIIIGVFILFLVLYNIFIGVLAFTLSQSIWVTLGLIILVLALIKNVVYESDIDNKWVEFIKELIFYIPCLITDAIEFIMKDYSETPRATFIVFIIIIIYCLIFFILPLINTDGGYLLISEPKNLNINTTFSTQDIILASTSISSDKINPDFSYNDISYAPPPEIVQNYPRDKLTANIETFTIEGFSGLVQEDTTYNFKTGSEKSKKRDTQNFDITKLYKRTFQTTSYYDSKLSSGMNAFWDMFKPIEGESPYIYNYGLSFWLYINTFHFRKNTPKLQRILELGDRLSIMYDNTTNELIIYLDETEYYRSKGILFQRWNHIVVNSKDAKITLFINNNLVATYTHTISDFELTELLHIGSRENTNFGSICNLRYYKNILDLSKIKSIYKKYNKKNPPI